jgi:hypothetical protein
MALSGIDEALPGESEWRTVGVNRQVARLATGTL